MKYAFAIVILAWSAIAQAGVHDKLPPEAYRDPVDQQIARTGKGVPGRPVPCGYERDGGQVIESQSPAYCYKMLPQQRWRGLWVSGHEFSIFCPEPARTCALDSKNGNTSLENGPGGPGYGSLYRVDFVGRRTMYQGNYDGLGMTNQVVVMDKVISIELIRASPITHIKKCAAAEGVRRARETWCFEGQSRK